VRVRKILEIHLLIGSFHNIRLLRLHLTLDIRITLSTSNHQYQPWQSQLVNGIDWIMRPIIGAASLSLLDGDISG
jgi:hypothetical protein